MGIMDSIKRAFTVSTSGRYPRIIMSQMETDSVGYSNRYEVTRPNETFENDVSNFLKTYPALPYIYAAVHKVAGSASIVPIQVKERTPVKDGETEALSETTVRKYHRTILSKQEAGGYDEISSTAEVNMKELVVSEHPLLSLIKYPNPRQTTTLLMYSTYAFLELTGNAFWLLTRDPGTGEVSGIYTPRPDLVKVIPAPRPGERDRISYVRTASSGETTTWEQEDVVHFRYFNPLSDVMGMGPISPATESMILDLYCLSYNKAFFKNSARPDVLLVLPSETRLDETTFNRIREQWNALHSGTEAAHKTAVLEGGVDVKLLSNSRKDMEFTEQSDRNRMDILSVMGVDPILVGIRKNSTSRDELREIERYFWESTMLPKMINVMETIETFLFPKVHPIPISVFQEMYRNMAESSLGSLSESQIRFRLRSQDNPLVNELSRFSVRYNTSRVRALQEAASDRSQIHVRYVSMGVMTPNDVRRELELPPVSWGDRPPPNAAYGLAVSRGDVNEMRTAIEPQHVASPSEMSDLQGQVAQNAQDWSNQ